MNPNYTGAMGVFVVAALALGLLHYLQTARSSRYFLASLLEAVGVLGGATVGGVFIKADGLEGLFLRLGVLVAVALPLVLLAAYLRRRRDHAA